MSLPNASGQPDNLYIPCILLVPRGENKWMLHLWSLCEDGRWHLFFLYWQVLYRWNRQSSTSVIETNKTSVELSLPFDEDYIIEIKPFSDGGDGSSSEQIRIPKISSENAFFSPFSPACLISLPAESGLERHSACKRLKIKWRTLPPFSRCLLAIGSFMQKSVCPCWLIYSVANQKSD